MLVSMLVNSFLRSENIESSVSRRYSPLRRSMARCCNIQCGSKGLYLHNPTIGTAKRDHLRRPLCAFGRSAPVLPRGKPDGRAPAAFLRALLGSFLGLLEAWGGNT